MVLDEDKQDQLTFRCSLTGLEVSVHTTEHMASHELRFMHICHGSMTMIV